MTIFAENKKALHDYEIIKEYQAGISLYGFEVKAVRTGKVNLKGAFVVVRGGEAFVVNMNISPYQPNNTSREYDPKRTRKLLLTKKEIKEIAGYESKKGLTVIPISVYNLRRYIKLRIAVVRSKKKYDKREEIKKRDLEREIRRSLKY